MLACAGGSDVADADLNRRNKLELRALATENRRTLELEDVPIRPTKPFFFSKVASYAGEELLD